MRAAVLGFSIGGLVSALLVAHSSVEMTPGELTQPTNVVMAAGPGGLDAATQPGEPKISKAELPLDRAQPPLRLDEVVRALDADLGDEGIPVDRQEIEQALRADQTLAGAILD